MSAVLDLVDAILAKHTAADAEVASLWSAMTTGERGPQWSWPAREFDRGGVSMLLSLGPLVSNEARHQAILQLFDGTSRAAWADS